MKTRIDPDRRREEEPADPLQVTPAQLEILRHTAYVAAGGFYCGGGKDMDALVSADLMEYAGKKSFVPDPYFRITNKGREALRFGVKP